MLSPNNDGYNDITTIHYQLPADGYLITIQIYTPSANLVTTLCNNMLAGTEGDIVWNGTAKDKTMPVGIYILYIQATHPTQKTLTEKLICVISSP